MLTGNNGILSQAQKAKTETENAAANEAAILDEYNKYLNNAVGGTSTKPEDAVNAKDVLIPNENGATEEERSPYVEYNGMICRVLYNDDIHGIQIVKEESVDDVSVNTDDDWEDWNNIIDILNDKAKEYMGTIAIDARCLGSLATLKDGKFQGDITTDVIIKKEFSDKDEFKVADTNYEEDVNQITKLGLNIYSILASRYIEEESDESAEFGLNYLVGDAINKNNWFEIKGVGIESIGCSLPDFCPVFLIDEETKIISGTGSKEEPYVIG